MKSICLALLGTTLAVTGVSAEMKTYTRNVAIVVYENAEPLDWTGPYEVYNDAAQAGEANGLPAFNVYIVSKTKEPVNAQGLNVVPNYSIQDAPKPDIVIFPGGPASKITEDPEFFAWAKQAAIEAEIAQSVCTGAFVLGKAGLLDGLQVTTFHGSIDRLQEAYPKTTVHRGRRFIDSGHVVTTAGISAGIDGSLHVVARLLGRRAAESVAMYMEYAWSPEPSLAMGYTYLNPSTDDSGRLNQVGEMHLEEKRYSEAEKAFRSLVKRNPENYRAWSMLGESLSGTQQHAEAAQAFSRSASDSKNQMAAYTYYRAAGEFAEGGKKNDAITMLGKAIEGGYPRERVEKDARFASLLDEPRVKQMLASEKP
ncbi:MAG TPA: DJ-1/PfpI family protein [Candidatus Eisenbacteria bacterium]|nr:DJ-1/PfpI family protein [Candidatus Eisenbacteria bacterium]